MAGIVTHLAIANKILKELPEGVITNKGLFHIGATAPDAIHVRPNFTRADKKHTHLRTGIFEQLRN